MTAKKTRPAKAKTTRPAKPRAKAPAKAKAAPKAAAPERAKADVVEHDDGVSGTLEALRQSEPKTLVGGAELAGAALANNEVAVMEEGATHPVRDE